MSFLGNNSGAGAGDPGNDPKKPSPARIGVWLVVGAVGVYMVASGVIGIISGG
ncbi:hypothetical protein LQ938_13015 [Microbacterium sp. cx-55]|uniref:hypothetical protein n=1 Tax=Microbacterium sp. cx-55 TaxID=2875948 RepID=UPI001CBC19C2|nr:hypothetical protein [Microbacterium sp. cx-55]MBZ4487814.1 hypothetical protein [Microbacterium sp. cx-55]UGB34774.1 hypothetical protein LQ938_13015 [Microbacterium sp. cx-55]